MVTSTTFSDVRQDEVTTLQAQFPDLADVLSRAAALVRSGAVFPEDTGREAMVRSSRDATVFYHVNGTCTCPAAQHYAGPCKHWIAWRLYQRVADRLAVDQECWTVDLDTEVLGTETPAQPLVSIPAEHLVTIQGKQYIRYAGLLQLAHQRGLVSLKAWFTPICSTRLLRRWMPY